MRGGRTPVVSFGPLTLVVAVVLVPALEVYEAVRRWRDDRRASKARTNPGA